VPTPLRLDPGQRFTCSQCGRCCYRWDVLVSDAEIAAYRRHNAAAWYRDSRADAVGTDRDLSAEAGGAKVDPFEPIPGWPGLQRIRKRADGGCGFLSADNRCRIHEELGGDRKPLTCRIYPYSLHPAPDAVVVMASFGCPTIIANQGEPIGTGRSLKAIEAMRGEWFGTRSTAAIPRQLVEGRDIDSRSARVLRESLLAIWNTEAVDIRTNIRRMAAALEEPRPTVTGADSFFALNACTNSLAIVSIPVEPSIVTCWAATDIQLPASATSATARTTTFSRVTFSIVFVIFITLSCFWLIVLFQ